MRGRREDLDSGGAFVSVKQRIEKLVFTRCVSGWERQTEREDSNNKLKGARESPCRT